MKVVVTIPEFDSESFSHRPVLHVLTVDEADRFAKNIAAAVAEARELGP